MKPTPEEMTERLIDAAVDYERAEGIYAAPARRELSEARAAIEEALRATQQQRNEANAALNRIEARKGEDVDAWAERLGKDLGSFTD